MNRREFLKLLGLAGAVAVGEAAIPRRLWTLDSTMVSNIRTGSITADQITSGSITLFSDSAIEVLGHVERGRDAFEQLASIVHPVQGQLDSFEMGKWFHVAQRIEAHHFITYKNGEVVQIEVGKVPFLTRDTVRTDASST